jgi:hypothetical protein
MTMSIERTIEWTPLRKVPQALQRPHAFVAAPVGRTTVFAERGGCLFMVGAKAA